MKKNFVKRLLASVMLVVTLVVSSGMAVSAADPIKVFVDSKQVEFDVQPRLIGGRTMVPLRAIFEAIGAVVNWDGETQSITAYNEAYIVKATINNNVMTVNNSEKTMDVAPMIVDGRTLVPARFVAEAFDCEVNWDGKTKTVAITTKPIDYSAMEQDTAADKDNTPAKEPEVQVEEKPAVSDGTITFNKYSFDPIRKIKIVNTKMIRGAEANKIVADENRYNDKPSSTQEWVFMEFKIDYISSDEGAGDLMEASDVIFKSYFFDGNGLSLPVYSTAAFTYDYKGKGIFDIKMYPGSSAKVVYAILTDKSAEGIKLRVDNKSEKDVTWIPCNG